MEVQQNNKMTRLSQTGKRYDENGRPIKNPSLFSINRKREHVGRTDQRNEEKRNKEKSSNERRDQEQKYDDSKYGKNGYEQENFEFNNDEYSQGYDEQDIESLDNIIQEENKKKVDSELNFSDLFDLGNSKSTDGVVNNDQKYIWILWVAMFIIIFLFDIIF
jgi:hypothetical protein